MAFANIGAGPNPPELVHAVIEIPKGSSNKYEVDKTTGLVKLDRVLYSPLFYPCDYGYIPNTLFPDGDPLDILVLLSHPTFPGCIVEARPIGLLLMSDEKGRDDKVIAVASRDPRFGEIDALANLGEHFKREIVHFFEIYKNLEEKSVEVLGWEEADSAKALIMEFVKE